MLVFKTNIKSPFLGFSIVFYFFEFLRFFYFFFGFFVFFGGEVWRRFFMLILYPCSCGPAGPAPMLPESWNTNIDENNQLLDAGSVAFLLKILNQHSITIKRSLRRNAQSMRTINERVMNADSKFPKEMLRYQHPIIDYFHLCLIFQDFASTRAGPEYGNSCQSRIV